MNMKLIRDPEATASGWFDTQSATHSKQCGADGCLKMGKKKDSRFQDSHESVFVHIHSSTILNMN